VQPGLASHPHSIPTPMFIMQYVKPQPGSSEVRLYEQHRRDKNPLAELYHPGAVRLVTRHGGDQSDDNSCLVVARDIAGSLFLSLSLSFSLCVPHSFFTAAGLFGVAPGNVSKVLQPYSDEQKVQAKSLSVRCQNLGQVFVFVPRSPLFCC